MVLSIKIALKERVALEALGVRFTVRWVFFDSTAIQVITAKEVVLKLLLAVAHDGTHLQYLIALGSLNEVFLVVLARSTRRRP